MEIVRSIEEQHEIMLYSFDPFDFIGKYIAMFEKQLKCSTKVFLFQIPYFQIFVKEFDRKMEEQLAMKKLDVFLFDEIEILVCEFQLKRFHDQEFCQLCISTILKWIDAIISRVCLEIEDYQFENVAMLFKYCPFNIDLTKFLAFKIIRELMSTSKMMDSLLEIQIQIENINAEIREDRRSILIEEICLNRAHNEKYCKILSHFRVPKAFYGTERIIKYDIHQVFSNVICHIASEDDFQSVDVFYIHLMSICGELSKYEGFEQEVAALKKLAADKLF